MDSVTATGYAPVNGLQMYYEIRGSGGVPLVLLHGAYGMIEMWGPLLAAFAETRQVIAVDQQAHGRTADIDRPLSFEQMADDTAALLDELGIAKADLFGYSMGGNIALQMAIRRPELVRKLVAAAGNIHPDGYYPEALAGIKTITPEVFAGSPMETAYRQVAPDPDGFPGLVAQLRGLGRTFTGWPPEEVAAIASPALLIVGDSDVVRPEHAIEMFRLLGGGVPGDLTGLPNVQLAVLPGTTHVTLIDRGEWLLPIVSAFLDATMADVAG